MKLHQNKFIQISLLSIIFILSFMFFFFGREMVHRPGVTYYLRSGSSIKVVLEDLENKHLIPNAFIFSLYIYPQKSLTLKAGTYLLPQGSTPLSIWKQLTTGSGLLYYPFTIVPGKTFREIKEELSRAEGFTKTLSLLSDKDIMQHLGAPNLLPEGNFYPETYFFAPNTPDFLVLKRAFNLMQKKLNDLWANRAPNLPYKTPYEALIAASLIEKEAYFDSERPRIASVLVNRLRKNMLLQFDPTVIYGLGARYDGKIHKENLSEKNDYNTYTHKGLPITPIAIPSLSSLYAALHPEETDYIYFVARGDRTHQFSKTLTEHNAAVEAIKRNTSFFNEKVVLNYIQRNLSNTSHTNNLFAQLYPLFINSVDSRSL